MSFRFKFKRLLTIATAGLLFAGPTLSASAQDKVEVKEAPLVSDLKDLRKLSSQLVAISEPSGAATVSLVSRGGGGAGSGVIVSADGLILTAAHVVGSLGEEVIVIFPDGSRKPAKKLGGDFDRDAAMVQITEEGSYPHVKVGQSKDLLRNQWCVAVGHPGGFDPTRTPPVRLGRVLDNGHFITTDCAVVGGDSGGPLFDVRGKVIGIHSNIGANLTENRHVPIAVFLEQWDAIKGGKKTGQRFAGPGPGFDPNRPVLGIQLGEPGEDGGVRLRGVSEGSPAQGVGLAEGDVVTRINDEAVNGAEELIVAVSQFKAGDEVKVTYLREGEEKKVDVKLVRLGEMLQGAPRGERPPRRRFRPDREAEEEPKEDRAAEEEDKKNEEAAPTEKEEEEPKPAKDEEPGGENKEQAGAKEVENLVEELLEDALKKGELELGQEELEKLGGREGLQKMIEELAKALGPEALRDLMEMPIAGPDHFFESSMKALVPITAKAAKSVVTIQVDGKQVALGTVVSREGHIMTKDIETQKGKVTRKAGEESVELKLVKRFPKRDLALFQGSPKGLVPVKWASAKERLPIGTILTTGDSTGEPLGIGLVSVRQRPMSDIGFLGIQAGEGEGGVKIMRIVDGSPAGKSGLRPDDLLTRINGKEFDGPFEFGNKVRSYRAGDEVEFTYRRGEKEEKIKVKLAALEESQTTPRFRRMNELSGPLSARVSGYPEVLQHDIPLDPAQCGGPLLDLDGRCVGINVSRAGRVKTLAVPVSDVLELLAEVAPPEVPVAENAQKPGEHPAPAPEGADKKEALEKEREKVLRELRKVEERLKDVEKRLDKLKAE